MSSNPAPSRATAAAAAATRAGGGGPAPSRGRRRPLTVGTPPPAALAAAQPAAATSPINRSPVRRLASAGHYGPSAMSPTRKSALFSGLPFTELLESCARKGDSSISTPDMRRLHGMIQARHGGAYPAQRPAGAAMDSGVHRAEKAAR